MFAAPLTKQTSLLFSACSQAKSFFFQSVVLTEYIYVNPGLPFRFLHLEVRTYIMQDKFSKALTAGSVISDLPARALAKQEKGHG